ncbi:DUF1630-domain-containing protein [Artomyces pyxidatus]|uniref:DUF1630-domain-containing protein n=1 Tax=Artomyces pyxidatus TaxID=48021 RepID=A0ACB8TFJ9_9AGAM|nr:DUF1630-domain-containing protein [Artomyces pyxidatus]
MSSSSSSLQSTSATNPASTANLQQVVPTSAVTPRRRLSSTPRSPSSPDLTRIALPPILPIKTLTRSRTLPRRSPTSAQFNIPTLEGVTFEADKLESLRRWILGLAIGTSISSHLGSLRYSYTPRLVDFDLELGPVVSCVFPPFQLYPFEAENIAFSAFPDSSQFREGSSMHSFRIREHPPPRTRRPSLAESRDREPSPDGFLYGYSHFNLKRDSSSKRGYVQRSILILTHHPYPSLFYALLSKLGPLYHTHGEPILEVASHNIASWSAPIPGQTIELGFVGSVIHAELPTGINEQQLCNTAHLHTQTDQDWHIMACAPPPVPPPISSLEKSVSHLWSIWECLVLCEPILIYGPSPALTSQAVWWLRDIFRPIPWAGDFRPYFTIHDKDHRALVNDRPPKAGLLLGVTNPFFEKACSHWPHVLSLGGSTIPGEVPAKSVGTSVIVGPLPGWQTKTHKRFISKDRPLLQRLEDAFRGGPDALAQASTELRRHFSSRSVALLVPLNRYLNTLIPSPAETLKAGPTVPRLKPFNTANFLASLKTHGAPLPFRSSKKQREFYEAWLRTSAFGLWLAQQEEIVDQVLKQNAEKATE